MVLTISKRKAVPWAQFLHLRMQIFSWENLKNYSFTPTLRNFSTFYCRFIDDIFFLWNGTEAEVIKIIHNLNKKHSTIKFEFTDSRTSITFLDTKVHKNENGTLCATIFRKPSGLRNFLHYKSAHPKALKDSIPYSQALRIKRICSKTSEVIKHLKDLKDAFIKRGYESKILDHLFERAMSVDRKILLENKEKPSTQGNLPLILTFYKTLPNTKNIVDQHWHILSVNENLRKAFDKRLFIVYRKNTNLY